MLAARSVDANDVLGGKQADKMGLKSNKLKNSTNTRKGGGLRVSNATRAGLTTKPRPLQASTNTIHTKHQEPASNHLKLEKNEAEKEPIKKKTQAPKLESNITPNVKIDENDVGNFNSGPYDPLEDFNGFDEELFQKVLKLEIADDGLPSYKSDEPFDF